MANKDVVVRVDRGESAMDHWAVGELIDLAAGPKTTEKNKEVLRRELVQRAKDFAGPTPGPVERVLAETAAINWFALRSHEVHYARAAASKDGLTARQAESYLRRIDGAHRRLMASLKTLATVRRLALPAVQINVARQQVNQFNAGGPS